MKFITAPSILSADFACLESEIKKIEQISNSWVHIDVMDGHFVPNLTFGPCVVKSIRNKTNLFFDAHLMVDGPSSLVKDFANAGVNAVTFHIEETHFPLRLIKEIRTLGLKVGVSLNPATPLSAVYYLLPLIDILLIMSVEPGFSGQKFIPFSIDKIKEAQNVRKEKKLHFLISVDGGINQDTAEKVILSGADVLVMGSFFFKNDFTFVRSFLSVLKNK